MPGTNDTARPTTTRSSGAETLSRRATAVTAKAPTSRPMSGSPSTADTFLDEDLVDVAPAPVLARLDRPHDRVVAVAVVRRRVLVRRGVAARDVPAGEALPQVHPVALADREAVGAALGGAGDDVLADRVEMAAGLHVYSSRGMH